MARPQTPHVPSCRLKLGTPWTLVCVLKTHGKSREFTGRANHDRRDGGGKMVVMARGKINSRTYPGSNTRSTRPVKPRSPIVVNKTVFHHEISVRLCRLRRIKSSYESHVIDVVDFNDGRDFRTTRKICHYVDFGIFVSGFCPFKTQCYIVSILSFVKRIRMFH